MTPGDPYCVIATRPTPTIWSGRWEEQYDVFDEQDEQDNTVSNGDDAKIAPLKIIESDPKQIH